MKYKGQIEFCDFLLSVQFAKDVINSNLDKFTSRKQDNKFKIYNDILIGKICEYVVHKQIDNCSEPDLRIYPSRQKSFDPDLTINDYSIHVKSCAKNNIFGISWVFQPEDKLVTSPEGKDFLALCIIDDKYNVEFDLIRASEVVGLYKPPIKQTLNKKVLYLQDLDNLKKAVS